ncbi:MAG: hypothetical protein EA361_00435 [Bacteroidetes bacterium]|nr:MAG: hypothetical protein EA361_00435 [Bacteroidota bacterium]
MMKIFSVLIFVVFFINGCTEGNNKGPEKRIYPHYDIDLRIDPQAQEIEVNGKLEINLANVSEDTLTFYLDQGMQVASFTLNGEEIAVFDTSPSDNRFMPMARKIFMDVSALSQKDQLSVIAFSYKGTVSQLPEMYANRIGPQWTEMGLYYPWFPFSIDQLITFTYDLRVEAPAQYEIFGLGNVEKKQGFTRISSSIPVSDIVVCLSEDVRVFTSEIGDNQLKIFHHSFGDTMVHDIAESITMMIRQYNEWFGDKSTDISLIESKRIMGGGYARTVGVVLSGLDQEKFYANRIRHDNYFAHEFAHLWWYKADFSTWEDWLNESFAEYSALMILRKRHGQEVFDGLIERMKKATEDAPPVWGFDRMGADHRLVQKVLYNKGPVLLYELEQAIGKEAFVRFCRELINNDIRTTSELLKILESNHGREVAENFRNMLKT